MSHSNPYYYNDQFDDADEDQQHLNDDISFNLHSSEQVDDICLDYDDDDEEDDIMFNGYNTGMEMADSLRPGSSGSAAKRMEAATLMTMMHQSNPVTSQVDSGGFASAMVSNSHYSNGNGVGHHYGMHPANSAPAPSSRFPPTLPSMDYYTKAAPAPDPLRAIQYASAGHNQASSNPAMIHSYDMQNNDRHHLAQHNSNPLISYSDVNDDRHHHHHHLAPPVTTSSSSNIGSGGRGRGRGGRGGRGRGGASKKTNTPANVDLNIPRQLNLPVFTSYISLGSEEDKYWLSELQCYLRSNFAEAFGASEKDIAAPVSLLQSLSC